MLEVESLVGLLVVGLDVVQSKERFLVESVLVGIVGGVQLDFVELTDCCNYASVSVWNRDQNSQTPAGGLIR